MPPKFLETDIFAELRQKGGYYVDKTRFLEQFLYAPAKATLLTRPRRFGKSLLMSMLAEFFDITKDSRELFVDLAVSSNDELCAQWMNQCPVISLTFKDVKMDSYELALKGIHSEVHRFCNNHKYLLSSELVKDNDKDNMEQCLSDTIDEFELEHSLYSLTSAMSSYYGKSAIVLIDEYDVPLAKSAEKGYYDEMIDFMFSLLSPALKSNPYLEFGILTGVLRITTDSIFSGLNNLDYIDISSPEYEDIFGFTQEEVDKMLADAGFEDRRDIIREWYGGYHFGNRTDMYCPWSITKYMSALQKCPSEPQAYWVNTSGNALTKDFVDHVPANIQDEMASLLAGNSIDVRINEILKYSQIYNSTNNFWTFLYLTGYLTTTSDSWGSSSSRYNPRSLTIPNKEVRQFFKDECDRLTVVEGR